MKFKTRWNHFVKWFSNLFERVNDQQELEAGKKEITHKPKKRA